jgi:hypothetical protein
LATATLRHLAAEGDCQARSELAQIGYDRSLPAVLALTRNNRLYDIEDVKQQVWVFALEAVDKDRGVGDVEFFMKWYILNRLRDWIGAAVRRYAYAECECCAHKMPIKSAKRRECAKCGAGPEKVKSVSFVDRGEDVTRIDHVRGDDHTGLFVEEFLAISESRERDIILGYMTGMDRAQLAVKHGVSPGRISQIVSKIQKNYITYVNSR